MHKLIYAYRWFSIYEGFHDTPYVACTNGVMTVPVTPDGQVIMIQEPTAYGDGELALFLPSGGIEPNEDPLVCANRELQEEIGLSAARIDYLGYLHPWVKYLNASITIYLARDFTPSRLQGDEDYAIVQEQVPLASFESLMATNRLTDSSVITALFLARQKLAQIT